MRSSNHSRSQSSRRCPDLGAVFDAHVRHEFEDKDLNATMGTMVDEPYVHHVPTMTGGVGRRGVYNFYKDHFIGRTPGDAKLIRVSRTVDEDQVVDELVLSFTHDREIDFLLPSVAPTGRQVEIPLVVVMRFRDGKVSHEHIY